MSLFPLKQLLEFSSTKDELPFIAPLFDPNDTLRVFPLEPSYRAGLGDFIRRRVKLWNTLDYLWLEGETWDFEGGRFERRIIALCPIADASKLSLSSPLNLRQLEFASSLSRLPPNENTSRQHTAFRSEIHQAIEMGLSSLAAKRPCGENPRIPSSYYSKMTRSRQGEIELWIERDDTLQTAVQTSNQASAFKERHLLTETIAGQPGTLEYWLRQKGTFLELDELYQAKVLDQEIQWTTVFGQTESTGLYLPLSTLNTLLREQSAWSHWQWNPGREGDDLSLLARSIHPTGDFFRLREYLGKGGRQQWHDRINAATKWDNFALILSAALHPQRNLTISNRLKASRAKTCYFRLLYRGGVLIGTCLKHAWAFGWADRPNTPQFQRHPFSSLEREDLRNSELASR